MTFLRYTYKQPNYWTCGPAVARLVLHSFGKKRDIEDIIRDLGTTKEGTANRDMKRLFKRHRIKFTEKKKARISNIKKYLKSHMVLVAYWIPSYKEAHYSVIKKIDSKRVYFHDTWFGSNHSYSIKYFLKNWWDDEEERWLMLIKKS